jgi:hypothetical protein
MVIQFFLQLAVLFAIAIDPHCSSAINTINSNTTTATTTATTATTTATQQQQQQPPHRDISMLKRHRLTILLSILLRVRLLLGEIIVLCSLLSVLLFPPLCVPLLMGLFVLSSLVSPFCCVNWCPTTLNPQPPLSQPSIIIIGSVLTGIPLYLWYLLIVGLFRCRSLSVGIIIIFLFKKTNWIDKYNGRIVSVIYDSLHPLITGILCVSLCPHQCPPLPSPPLLTSFATMQIPPLSSFIPQTIIVIPYFSISNRAFAFLLLPHLIIISLCEM